MMILTDLLKLAKLHAAASTNPSAPVGIADAEKLIGTDREKYARGRLLDSLKYSIGILHRDYELATAERFEVYNSETGEVARAGNPGGALSWETAREWAGNYNSDYSVANWPKGGPFRVRPFSPQGKPNDTRANSWD